MTKDRFDFDPADRTLIDAKLMDLAEGDDDERDGDERAFTFKKPGNAMNKASPRRQLGRSVPRRRLASVNEAP